jgi:hypothetical protein
MIVLGMNMLTTTIFDELQFIDQLLETSLRKMEELLGPKTRNVLWQIFFPAGQFIQQKSLAREISLLLLEIDTRLRDINQVLLERNHPFQSQIGKLLDSDFITMSKMLVELPERAQYIIPQVESIKALVEADIQEIIN